MKLLKKMIMKLKNNFNLKGGSRIDYQQIEERKEQMMLKIYLNHPTNY